MLEHLLELYPEYTSIYGPYTRADGRQHIVLNNANKSKGEAGKTKTISYPKAIMENYLRRRLLDNETVDHIDGDFTNNDIANLQVLDRAYHAKKDVVRADYGTCLCAWCGKEFKMTKSRSNDRAKNRPHFCSKSCSGKYGAYIQKGGEPFDPQEISKTYYDLRKSGQY